MNWIRKKLEGIRADLYFIVVNAWRRWRFRLVDTQLCDSCGLLWPATVVARVKLKNAVVGECADCREFRSMIRGMLAQ